MAQGFNAVYPQCCESLIHIPTRPTTQLTADVHVLNLEARHRQRLQRLPNRVFVILCTTYSAAQ
eukprot:5331428-Amphidinium_carterae.2